MIPALGRLRAETAEVKVQPGLHSKLLVSLGYIMKPCLKQKHRPVIPALSGQMHEDYKL